jgi:hypothetical protein
LREEKSKVALKKKFLTAKAAQFDEPELFQNDKVQIHRTSQN